VGLFLGPPFLRVCVSVFVSASCWFCYYGFIV
jgi:hypothetical protein